MDLISIIVPVYKTEKYISRCLISITNQTYRNIEIIVVNDGSPDDSLDIINEFKKNDNRIKIYSQKNGGLSKARNLGIKKAKGKYIGFVDSDDYIEKNMFEELHASITKVDADMAICGWYVVNDGKIEKCKFNSDEMVVSNLEAIDMLLNHVSFDNFACNKLYKKELFENVLFDEGEVLEDLRIMYKLLGQSHKVSLSSKPLYFYELHDDSITTKLSRKVNVDAFRAFTLRKNEMEIQYPQLNDKIQSNYFTACQMYFIISLRSIERNKRFEKELIKSMRQRRKYVIKDMSKPLRVKISSILISYIPYIYFKIRGLK